jgi:hypothetical protein
MEIPEHVDPSFLFMLTHRSCMLTHPRIVSFEGSWFLFLHVDPPWVASNLVAFQPDIPAC